MLRDNNTYDIIKKDPTKKLTNDISVIDLLARWKTKDFNKENKNISKTIYNSTYCSDSNLPIYRLSKIHKLGFNFRIMISSIDNPTHQLAYYLHKTISKNIAKPFSRIDNSFQLVQKLNASIDKEYELIIGRSFPIYQHPKPSIGKCVQEMGSD